MPVRNSVILQVAFSYLAVGSHGSATLLMPIYGDAALLRSPSFLTSPYMVHARRSFFHTSEFIFFNLLIAFTLPVSFRLSVSTYLNYSFVLLVVLVPAVQSGQFNNWIQYSPALSYHSPNTVLQPPPISPNSGTQLQTMWPRCHGSQLIYHK